MIRWLLPLALALGLLTPLPVFAQPTPAPKQPDFKDSVRAKYTKYEFKIPMRDGTKLFTAVYVPKDDSQKYPMLFIRTPYSVAPYGADKYPTELRPGSLFTKSGYIFVYQDVRGRWMSEGDYENVRPHNPAKKPKEFDESSDTYDTIDWLLKNVKGHNGKVGITGISYPGFYAVCGMIDAHPAVKAVSPQAPVTDWFIGDDFHHNGCLFLPHCFNFMYGFGKPRPEPTKKFGRVGFDHETPDGYKFFLEMGPIKNADTKFYKGEIAFWKEVMKHGTYDDFWKARNIRAHVKNIKPAVLTVGGWFDAENLFGALEIYKHAEANSPPKF
ncbi:MAG: CocE/NonD family hydrolase, partial [Planctomycetia bacterium]|nr:CocE/NonD family hydrolase [Planctomycetia bacterium]